MSTRKRKTATKANTVDSKSDSTKFTIDWKMNNFFWIVTNITIHEIESKCFIDKATNRNWQLCITKKNGFIVPYLLLKQPEKVENFFFNYCFSFLDVEDKPYLTYNNFWYFNKSQDYWGVSELLTLQKLLDNKESWVPNSVFHFHCVIQEFRHDLTLPHSAVIENTLFMDETFSDITFRVQNKEFKAHKVIVTNRAPILLQKFRKSIYAKNSIDIDLFDAASFQELLRYIYTDKVVFTEDTHGEDTAKQLLSISDMLQLPRLKKMSELKLIGELYEDNALEYLLLAEKNTANILKAFCIDVIVFKFSVIENTEKWNHFRDNNSDLVDAIIISKTKSA
ncbi:speckle-type POZ protein-like protein [Leptotrombidium deliense]|uniref:Speckle-type POZ protein-like protein n=1 Tax=Leptotrombidium deliense TaxID=299467 RepID=A0A443S0G2_9ACAR|nr:speckle-type POZ protein-like protein [Leptotrombidium deliense]